MKTLGKVTERCFSLGIGITKGDGGQQAGMAAQLSSPVLKGEVWFGLIYLLQPHVGCHQLILLILG